MQGFSTADKGFGLPRQGFRVRQCDSIFNEHIGSASSTIPHGAMGGADHLPAWPAVPPGAWPHRWCSTGPAQADAPRSTSSAPSLSAPTRRTQHSQGRHAG
jgi:hypothetical protein